MAFDYKKEYREFYLPPKKPGILEVPEMNFVAVRGKGNPNALDGEYQAALGLLYGIAFTIKMSDKGNHKIDGYFQYVVPPLEGLWWQEDTGKEEGALADSQREMQHGMPMGDTDKEKFSWISMIRLPEFVTKEVFDWAVREAEEKKQRDFSKAEFFQYEEGLCVQCMHVGSYDDEPETMQRMDAHLLEQGYVLDFSKLRRHHEIYLSDPRRTAPEKLRTVIRQPIRRS